MCLIGRIPVEDTRKAHGMGPRHRETEAGLRVGGRGGAKDQGEYRGEFV